MADKDKKSLADLAALTSEPAATPNGWLITRRSVGRAK